MPTPLRVMYQHDADGAPYNAHVETSRCRGFGCVPDPASPDDPASRLRTAAQAVVERWRWGREYGGQTYSPLLTQDLEALEAALKEGTP